MSCHGKPSDCSTFEKLLYLGEKPDIAKNVSTNCNVYRNSCIQNDNIIIQCCAKGYVTIDDARMISDNYSGMIRNNKALLKYLRANAPYKMLWTEFLKHLRM